MIRADAAYELWLLTRRMPALADDAEGLLMGAVNEGHVPARFAAHRSRSGVRRPSNFATSPHFVAAQAFLVAAHEQEGFLDPVRFSVRVVPIPTPPSFPANDCKRMWATTLPP